MKKLILLISLVITTFPVLHGQVLPEEDRIFRNVKTGEEFFYGMEIEVLLEMLGEPNHVFEKMVGTLQVFRYFYDELEIITGINTVDDMGEVVNSITLYGVSFETNKGIRVGNTMEELLAVYGPPNQDRQDFRWEYASYRIKGFRGNEDLYSILYFYFNGKEEIEEIAFGCGV